mgnify:FL=1
MGYLLTVGTTLTTGTYYATQTLNGCESLPLAVEITVNTTPPPSVPPFYSCTPATFGDIPVTISNLQYYTTLVGGTPLPLTTPIDNNGVYYVTQTVNGCESARTSCTVNVYNLQPPTGQSSQVLCQYKTLNDVLLYSQYNCRF